MKCLESTYCALFSNNVDKKHMSLYAYKSEEEMERKRESDEYFIRVLNDPRGSYMTMKSMINELGVFYKIDTNDRESTLQLTPIGKLVVMGKGTPTACEQILRTLMLIVRDIDNIQDAKIPLPISSLAPMYIIAMLLSSGTVSPTAKKNMKIHPKQDIAFGSYLFHEASRIVTSITDMSITPEQFSRVYDSLKTSSNVPLINKEHQTTLHSVLYSKDIIKSPRAVSESISSSLLTYSSINDSAKKYTLPESYREAREPVTMSKLSQINRVLRTYAEELTDSKYFSGNRPSTSPIALSRHSSRRVSSELRIFLELYLRTKTSGSI